MTKYTKEEVKFAREHLSELLHPGDTVYTILRNVSRSGLSRRIDVFAIRDNHPVYLTRQVACLCNYAFPRQGQGLRVDGCGMDMGFEVVYKLGRILFPEGFGIEGRYPNDSQGRPTSREMAAQAVKAGVKFYGRNGDHSGWDNDGGYALHQEWL